MGQEKSEKEAASSVAGEESEDGAVPSVAGMSVEESQSVAGQRKRRLSWLWLMMLMVVKEIPRVGCRTSSGWN